jgi:hypothetical protein
VVVVNSEAVRAGEFRCGTKPITVMILGIYLTHVPRCATYRVARAQEPKKQAGYTNATALAKGAGKRLCSPLVERVHIHYSVENMQSNFLGL